MLQLRRLFTWLFRGVWWVSPLPLARYNACCVKDASRVVLVASRASQKGSLLFKRWVQGNILCPNSHIIFAGRTGRYSQVPTSPWNCSSGRQLPLMAASFVQRFKRTICTVYDVVRADDLWILKAVRCCWLYRSLGTQRNTIASYFRNPKSWWIAMTTLVVFQRQYSTYNGVLPAYMMWLRARGALVVPVVELSDSLYIVVYSVLSQSRTTWSSIPVCRVHTCSRSGVRPEISAFVGRCRINFF